MNVDRMLQLADHIETLPHAPVKFTSVGPQVIDADDLIEESDLSEVTEFNMLEFHCGTTACIAGHAVKLFSERDTSVPIDRHAAILLGLDGVQKTDLFYNFDGYVSTEKSLEKITPKEAADAIRRMVKEQRP